MVHHILIKTLLALCIARPLLVVALTKIGNFKKDSRMDGKLCQLASLDFGLLRKVSMCAAKCLETENCISFFYNKQTTLCKGAPELVNSTLVCQDAANTGYYEDITYITGVYGANCTLSPCTMDNSLCLRGSCSCQLGYKYENSTGLCVTDCLLYGNTYIGYYDVVLNEPTIAEFSDISLFTCKKYCSYDIKCRSFGHMVSTGRCKLRSITAYEKPESLLTAPGADYYSRNCE